MSSYHGMHLSVKINDEVCILDACKESDQRNGKLWVINILRKLKDM